MSLHGGGCCDLMFYDWTFALIKTKHRNNYHVSCSDLREAVARLRTAEVNAVSGVLKLYFRELPEPLIPTELFQSLASALGKSSTHTVTNVC